MNIIVKATGEKKTAQYITTKSGSKRLSVDGKTYTDKKFNELFDVESALVTDSEPDTKKLYWRANVKALFEEIIECGGPTIRFLHTPLRITYHLLTEIANRANELQDPELNSIMARLALYAECDPYSPDFKGNEFTKQVIDKDPALYQ